MVFWIQKRPYSPDRMEQGRMPWLVTSCGSSLFSITSKENKGYLFCNVISVTSLCSLGIWWRLCCLHHVSLLSLRALSQPDFSLHTCPASGSIVRPCSQCFTPSISSFPVPFKAKKQTEGSFCQWIKHWGQTVVVLYWQQWEMHENHINTQHIYVIWRLM